LHEAASDDHSTGENAVGKNSANLSAIAAIGTSDVVIYHG